MNEEIKIRKSPKRIVLDVGDDFHKEIKRRALDRNISLKTYVLQALWIKLNEDRKYD